MKRALPHMALRISVPHATPKILTAFEADYFLLEAVYKGGGSIMGFGQFAAAALPFGAGVDGARTGQARKQTRTH